MKRVNSLRLASSLALAALLSAGCGDDGPAKQWNHSPEIASLTATPDSVRVSRSAGIVCAATDPDGDSISYAWTAEAGTLSGGTDSVSWTAPDSIGVYSVFVLATDGRGGLDFDSIGVPVVIGVPTISSLTATPSFVGPGDLVTLVCTAVDDDPDALAFLWDADAGTFAGSGDSVTWTAPAEEGVYEIRVAVDNGAGGIARSSVSAYVFGGTLLVQTAGGLAAVRLDGSSFPFAASTAPVEVVGTRIFVLDGRSITELDHSGSPVGTITCANPAVEGANFVMLPDASIVFLDNAGDKIHFVDPDGTFYDTVLMPEASDSLQSVSGVFVDNTLIVSETGTRKLVAVSLADLTPSIFRSFGAGEGRLGAVDHSDGVYYLCRPDRIERFTGADPVETVASAPSGTPTGVVAVGKFLYVAGSGGTVHRMDVETGETELLTDELDQPGDIEYVPTVLAP